MALKGLSLDAPAPLVLREKLMKDISVISRLPTPVNRSP